MKEGDWREFVKMKYLLGQKLFVSTVPASAMLVEATFANVIYYIWGDDTL